MTLTPDGTTKHIVAEAASRLLGSSANATISPAVSTLAAPAAGFQVMVTGQIVSISYPGVSNLYCRYAVTYGNDWRVLHGADAGLTQLAYRASQDDDIVLNFPIDISFKSTNPFGWPRLVFSVYGLDALGRDVVRGYGSIHIPTSGGPRTRYVPLFRPLSSSLLQQWTAMLTGSPPEYFDSKFITQNDGREVTRVTSCGSIQVQLHVVTNGMKQVGYHHQSTMAHIA